MEQNQEPNEETTANETTANAELIRSSSTFANSKTVKDFDLNKTATSFADYTPSSTTPHPSAFLVGCSSTNKEIVNQENKIGDGHFVYEDRKYPSKPSSSSTSKTLYSSSFSKFFLGQTMNKMTKSAPCENRDPSADFLAATQIASNKNMQSYHSSSNLHSDDVVREGPGFSDYGINLRDWLKSRGSDAIKNERLRLFRQIVHIVDVAHNRGIALLELRPSSFLLLQTGDVKYTGSTVEIDLLLKTSHDNTKKRILLHEYSAFNNFCVKMQKVGEEKMLRPFSRFANENLYNMEKKWYAFPEGFKIGDLIPFNIYCLGLFLFEFLLQYESIEALSAAMVDLQHMILPPRFVSENPEEAGFCFWLLHPNPSSRPTTRDILQCELINGSETASDLSNDEESDDLLLYFFDSLKQNLHKRKSVLLESMELLDVDIKVVETKHASRRTSDDYRTTMLRDKLLGNLCQLEDAYFSARTNAQLSESSDKYRSDKDVLSKPNKWSWVESQQNLPITEEKSTDRVVTFFDSICKFARYNKFEVCGALRNKEFLNSGNVICSLSFDREEEFVAAAGVSKKIKIFELDSILDENVDVQYPILEMSNKSKLSCVCWNNYIKNYLASTDYDGLVQMWDASTGQVFARYEEHQKRAWSVDFSHVDPTKFASGGDDCSIKMWSINERNSIGTIWNPANICCVQFSEYSSHLMAFGSADYKIYCYDLRHTKIPWCTLAGHNNAVSYVRFLDSGTIVSASTDNTLKLWDLKKTSLEGLSSNACSLTFSGHTNEKNFVGLAVLDGYIACGSETNEVYAYYRSLPMPITSHEFGYVDPVSGHETSEGNGQFVSSLCWRRKSQMIVAANSSGSIKVLKLV